MRKKKRKGSALVNIADSSRSEHKRMLRKPIIHILMLGFLGVLAYSNTFDVPFVFDDNRNIVENPGIRDLSNIPSMFVNIEGELASRPLALATFALNYSADGLDTTYYHLANLVLHIANGALLYGLVIMTAGLLGQNGGDMRYVALFSSLLFVVHPVQTESVTYVVTRSMLLAATFYFLGMLFFIKAVTAKRGRGVYAVCLFAVSLMGMASREDFVTFPLMLVVYDYFFMSGLRVKNVLKNLRFHLPVIAALCYLVFLVAKFEYRAAGFDVNTITPLEYFLTQFNVHWTYLRLLVFPVGQNLDYDYAVSRTLLEFPTAVSFMGYLGLWGLGVYLVKKRPVAAFSMLWFLITLAPASSVVPLADVIFEHRLYLASAGFFVLLSSSAYFLTRKRPVTGRFMTSALVLAVLALSASAYARNEIWRSEESLWEDTVKKSPNKARPHNNLGVVYKSKGRYDEAFKEFKTALGLKPDYADAYNNRGIIYDILGRYNEAAREFQSALGINPERAKFHNNLGVTYKKQGRYDEAVEEFQAAIRLKHYYAEFHNNLGSAYREQGRYDGALREFRKALNINPNDANAYNNFGIVYARQGRYDEAVKEFQSALRANPDDFEAHNNLGNVYESLGRYDEALSEFHDALGIDSENAEVHNNLGIVYDSLERYDEAVREYQTALRIDPGIAEAHNNLGAIYYKDGRYREAAEEFRAALEIKPRNPDFQQNLERALKRISNRR